MRRARLKRARIAAGVLRPGYPWQESLGLTLAAGWKWLLVIVDRELEYRTGFLGLPIALGLGVITYFVAAEEPQLWAGPALAAALLPFAVMLRGFPKVCIIAALFAALGFSAGSLRTFLVAQPMLDREHFVEVKGFIETMDNIRQRQRLVLRPTSMEGIEARALPFRLRIGTPGKTEALPGDFIAVRARLMPPSEAAMPGGYDFRRDSFFRSTGGVGYTIGPVRKEAATAAAPLDLRFNAMIDRWRNTMTERIARAIGGDAGALSAALITGKRGLISESANENLRGAGLYHIVSISGLHMVLAAGVMFWLIRAFLAAIPAIALTHPIKKYAAAAAMIGATFYCIFSGSEVATERSLIMTLVMLGAILVDRPALAMRNLAISALIVLAREPESLLGPSFQMSFAAVASLIAANQVWAGWKARHTPRVHGFLAGFIRKLIFAFLGIAATTLVATLATAPFSAFHFHRLNPYGIIGNSLGIPLVSLIVMPAAVAGTLLVPFGLDGFVWRIMGEGVSSVLTVARWVASIENASVTAPNMRGPGFALLVAALIIFVVFRTRLRWVALVPLALWVVTLGATPLPEIIIDPTARMALIRAEDGRYRIMAVGTPNRFTLSQWLPALGDGRLPTDPSLREGVRCDKSGCVARLKDGRLIALVSRADGLREDCRRAEIVITNLPGLDACKDVKLLGRAHFDRYGATKIITRTPQEWRLETGLDPTTNRPWRKQAKPTAITTLASPTENERSKPAARTPIPAPRTAETLEDDPALIPPSNSDDQ